MAASDRRESLSVIVPALNEEGPIKSVAESILVQVDAFFSDYEIILIDDGSTDRTGQIMDELADSHPRIRVLHNRPNCGLGACFQRGVAEARCSHVMMLCGDGGLPATSLPAIFGKVGMADIVAPYMLNLSEIKTPLRYAVSRVYTTLLNTIFGLQLRYFNGLPVHRLDLLRDIEITSSGFAVQGEVLVKLIQAGHSYVEVGVEGAAGKARSSAFRPSNVLSVAGTLGRMLWSVSRSVRRAPAHSAAEAIGDPPAAARS